MAFPGTAGAEGIVAKWRNRPYRSGRSVDPTPPGEPLRGLIDLHHLIDQHGGNGTILEWLANLTADCPRKRGGERLRPMPRALSRSAQGVVGRLNKSKRKDLVLTFPRPFRCVVAGSTGVQAERDGMLEDKNLPALYRNS